MHNYKSIDGQKYAGFILCVNVIKGHTQVQGKHISITNLSSGVAATVTVGRWLVHVVTGFFAM